MNKRFAIFAAGCLLLGATFAQIRQKNIVDEVIWVVGDSPILLSDVEDYRVNAEAEGQTFKAPYAQIPEQIAIQKLFLHQAELDSCCLLKPSHHFCHSEGLGVFLSINLIMYYLDLYQTQLQVD